MKISDPTLLGADFALNGKADITVRNLMLHNSGFPPDPSPNYCTLAPPGQQLLCHATDICLLSGNRPFGCPETSKRFPAENFSCQRRIWAGLMKQTLQHPIGQVYVYSDLRFVPQTFFTLQSALTKWF
jgi:CubicO group peptidase (beta-lactamase class C family)